MWTMLNRTCAVGLVAALGASSASAQQQDSAGWSVEPSLYLFLPGLTGTVGIGPFDIDLDSPSEAVIHLNFAALGTVRVAYGPWALTTDVLYANLDTTQGSSTLTMHQLLVEPTLSYRVFSWLEPLAGFRYFSVGGDLDGPTGRAHAITQGWFDPIFGANLQLHLSERVSLHFRGDVGGFGVGSKLTWQVFPFVRWTVSDLVSLDAGYRVLSEHYEHGTGAERLLFDVIELGPQIGIKFFFGF